MDKNIVITGGTSGIGFAVLKELVKRKDNVVAVGITQVICDDIYAKLDKPTNLKFIPLDLSSNIDIVKQSEIIRKHYSNGKIDAIVHCAAYVPEYFLTNEQGYEMQFQVNHLAIHHLTKCLLDMIKKANGKVINTSSRVHRWAKLDFDDLMNRKKYFLLDAYKKSKLCNVLYTYEFNRRYNQENMIAYSVDPGLVNTKIAQTNTSGFIHLFWDIRRRFGKNANKLIPYYMDLIDKNNNYTEPFYYKYGKPLEPSDYSKNKLISNKLWEMSELYIG